MFFGQFEHTIDEKGRMTIPSRFRVLLEQGAYVTVGFDGNLVVWPADVFEKVYTAVGQLSITNATARDLMRHMFGKASLVEFDRAGRILIPQFLRDDAGLTANAIVVGAGRFFEIWSEEEWRKKDQVLRDQQAMAEKYSSLDITVM